MTDARPESLLHPEPILPNSYWVTDTIAAGQYPGHYDAVLALERIRRFEVAGVDLMIDLTEDRDGLEPYDGLLTSCVHARHPIRDNDVPTVEQMVRILDTVDDAGAAGRTVYVHCWGGHGRTGTVVGCWLVRHGHAPFEAIEQIREWRRGIPKYKTQPDSPQTTPQHDFVHAWRPDH